MPPNLPPLPSHRPRGAPRGNRNAFKHGFYARSFTSGDKKDLDTCPFIGLRDEIVALRLINRRAVEFALSQSADPYAFQEASRIVVGLVAALNATIRTQMVLEHDIGSEWDRAVTQAINEVMAGYGYEPPVPPAEEKLNRARNLVKNYYDDKKPE